MRVIFIYVGFIVSQVYVLLIIYFYNIFVSQILLIWFIDENQLYEG